MLSLVMNDLRYDILIVRMGIVLLSLLSNTSLIKANSYL